MSLALFLHFLIAIYTLLIIAWGELMPRAFLMKNLNYRIGSYGHMNSRMREVQGTKDLDILFLGSSRAYRGFDTRVFSAHGYKVFNLGSSAQGPIQTGLLLERHLDSLNPRLVVFEVYPGTLGNDGVESSLDLIANSEIDFGLIKMAVVQNHIKVYNTLLFAMYRQGFGLCEDYKEEIVKDDDTYIKGGYVEKQLRFYKSSRLHEEYGLKINEMQQRAFERIISSLKERKIPYILVQAPTSVGAYASFLNHAEFDGLMKGYGAYYNYNETMELEDSLHFYDAYHLNQNGVNCFNERLLALIRDNKLL
jgi:hypothetical protein